MLQVYYHSNPHKAKLLPVLHLTLISKHIMPTSKGIVLSTDGNNFSVVFDINEIPLYGSGSFTTIVMPPFHSKNATLTYDDMEFLTGTRKVTGVVGKAKFNMVSEDDVKIEGTLEVPFPTEIPMTGQITWALG